MLARAAQRRSQRDAFRRLSHAVEQPYLSRSNLASTRRRGIATIATGAHRARKHPAVASQQRRDAATATGSAPHESESGLWFDQPSDYERPGSRPGASKPRATWSRRGKMTPLIIHDSLSTPSATRTFQSRIPGISGVPEEMQQNLTACLRVDRLDRAAALVRRLRVVYSAGDPELLTAHNLYLRKLSEGIIEGKDGFDLNKANLWFNVEMKANDIRPDAATYVYLLRAVMYALGGSKRERALRRYIALAEQDGEALLREVLASEAYSDDEHGILAQVRPDLIQRPPGVVHHDFEGQPLAPVGTYVSDPVYLDHSADTDTYIKPVMQKGMGLSTVREALSIFSDRATLEREIPYPHYLEGTKEERDREYARMRQDRLEEDSIEAAIGRWREENQNMQKMGIASALQTKPINAMMWEWYNALIPLFQEEMKTLEKLFQKEAAGERLDHDGQRALELGPYLETFKPEMLAASTLIVTIGQFGSSDLENEPGQRVSHLAMAIGNHLQLEHSLKDVDVQSKSSAYRNASPKRLQMLVKKTSKAKANQGNPEEREHGDLVYKVLGEINERNLLDWSSGVKAKVGALCISKLIEAAQIPIQREDPETGRMVVGYQPAFSHFSKYQGGRKTGWVAMHADVKEKMKREPFRGQMGTRYPMVVEPKPWTGFTEGGYLRYSVPFIRDKGRDEAQRAYAMAAIERGDMDQVLHGVTVLGKTPWRINRKVFNIAVEAWNSGEAVGSIAPENPVYEYPPDPGPDADRKTRALWIKTTTKIENEKAGWHSQRCFQNAQFEVARAFKNEVFYYPHSLDFRGRAYPIAPTLNHLGADLSRGLLTFAKGKALGETGFFWLKVHLANVFGYDKASLTDREKFAVEHIEDIRDSCDNPLNGKRWWLKAEDPWQCLATCFELKGAFDAEDPTTFISSLPVHQDGTCNGLQHYAALGGDTAGAMQVNLVPSDCPSDIYTAVAEIVKQAVAEDSAKGNAMAKLLEGKITRKVVKQTVMTNVYGVTFVGARDQVYKQLEDIMEEPKEIPNGRFALAGYVAFRIFQALGHMFNGAHEIQKWLGVCADRISTSITADQIEVISEAVGQAMDKPASAKKGRAGKNADIRKLTNMTHHFRAPVIWTTPLRMPVVQPYRRSVTKHISTVLQQLSIRQPTRREAVDKRKQLQAFPPNFIHSLDATHMLLSAIKCNEIGLNFASVHDSFWTHAADVPVMNRVLRDAFVRMHSEDIIGRLHEEFLARYKGHFFQTQVPTKSELGKQIVALRGRKKGVQVVVKEMLEEKERQTLLASEDPELRAKGEAMVTPAKLYLSVTDPAVLEVPEEMENRLLGDNSAPKRAKGSSVKAEGDEEAAVEAEAEDDFDNEDLLDPVLGEHDGEPEAEDVESEAEDAAAEADDAAMEAEEKPVDEFRPKAKKNRTAAKLSIWLPMSFPPVPKKGDFDVTRLRNSQYFFS